MEEKTSPQTESIKDLKAQIQELATVMKSGSTSHRPNPPAVERSPTKKFKRVNVKQNGIANVGMDAREGLVGPEANVSGPFLPGQRPLQCHKCKGWGHVKRVCPSHLNYMRGRMPENGILLPQNWSLQRHRLQLQKGPNNHKSSEDG